MSDTVWPSLKLICSERVVKMWRINGEITAVWKLVSWDSKKPPQLLVGNCKAHLNFIFIALLYGKTWSITLKCLYYSDIHLVFSGRKQLFPMWEDTCFKFFFLKQNDYREKESENLLTFASKYRNKPMRKLCWDNRFCACVQVILCLIFMANWNYHLRRHGD